MVLHPHSIKPIPPLTKEIAHKAFPKGNLYMTLRDELGTLYDDNDFAELYSSEGQPALHPGRLALICVMQYMANLSDRGAVEAIAARIDWKYALGLELTDPSFDSTVLSLFRSRLLSRKIPKLTILVNSKSTGKTLPLLALKELKALKNGLFSSINGETK
jgi:transposase